MRVFAAILAVALGASAALAQGDPRANYGPVTVAAAKTKAKAEAKPDKAKSDTKPEKAEAAPKTKAKAAKKDPPLPKEKPKAAKANAAKPATNGSASTAAPDPKQAGVKDAFLALPFADRVAMQSDLTWGGDFNGPIDGEFSDKLFEAAKAYQKRHKNQVTGMLSAEERTALATAVEPRKEQAGWQLMEDPVTGARVGIPTRFATVTVPLANGTRWSSEQGQLQIETFRIDTGATLDAVFEQQKKMPRRRVTGSSLQADSFVISGIQGLKKMVVRGAARNNQVRGITILYDQAMEGSIDPLVAPMSSAFVPFARFSLAGVTEAPRRKVEYGTGLFVSPVGHLLTDRKLVEGCSVIALPGLGNAERIAESPGDQLVLLRAYAARRVTPIGLLDAAPAGSADVTLVGVADPQAQGGAAEVSTVPAHVAGGTGPRTLDSAPAVGFAGAAALDAQGRFAGMVTLKPSVVAGPAGQPRAELVPTETIRNFLEAHFVAPVSGGASVDTVKASVTRVICVRK
jgi:hypothetical protein